MPSFRTGGRCLFDRKWMMGWTNRRAPKGAVTAKVKRNRSQRDDPRFRMNAQQEYSIQQPRFLGVEPQERKRPDRKRSAKISSAPVAGRLGILAMAGRTAGRFLQMIREWKTYYLQQRAS